MWQAALCQIRKQHIQCHRQYGDFIWTEVTPIAPMNLFPCTQYEAILQALVDASVQLYHRRQHKFPDGNAEASLPHEIGLQLAFRTSKWFLH